MGYKYKDGQIIEAVQNSTTVSDVMRYLGIAYISGGMHAYISRKIKKIGIDTSHFIGKKYINPSVPSNKKHWSDILVESSSDIRTNARQLRRALQESGTNYICNSCGIGNIWNEKLITLQVNHISGNPMDNRKENLEFLCPNCHSQTKTWGIKNKTLITGVPNEK